MKLKKEMCSWKTILHTVLIIDCSLTLTVPTTIPMESMTCNALFVHTMQEYMIIYTSGIHLATVHVHACSIGQL